MSARLQTLLLTVLLAAAPSIQAQPTRQELQTAVDAINRNLPANRGGPTTIYKVSLENDQFVIDSIIDQAKLRPSPQQPAYGKSCKTTSPTITSCSFPPVTARKAGNSTIP